MLSDPFVSVPEYFAAVSAILLLSFPAAKPVIHYRFLFDTLFHRCNPVTVPDQFSFSVLYLLHGSMSVQVRPIDSAAVPEYFPAGSSSFQDGSVISEILLHVVLTV